MIKTHQRAKIFNLYVDLFWASAREIFTLHLKTGLRITIMGNKLQIITVFFGPAPIAIEK